MASLTLSLSPSLSSLPLRQNPNETARSRLLVHRRGLGHSGLRRDLRRRVLERVVYERRPRPQQRRQGLCRRHDRDLPGLHPRVPDGLGPRHAPGQLRLAQLCGARLIAGRPVPTRLHQPLAHGRLLDSGTRPGDGRRVAALGAGADLQHDQLQQLGHRGLEGVVHLKEEEKI